MNQKSNKKMGLAGFALATLCASPSFAADVPRSTSVVRTGVNWKSIVGVISAPSVNNPVGNVNSGTFPWSVRAGEAHVDLATGKTRFEVHGLVINGQIFTVKQTSW